MNRRHTAKVIIEADRRTAAATPMPAKADTKASGPVTESQRPEPRIGPEGGREGQVLKTWHLDAWREFTRQRGTVGRRVHRLDNPPKLLAHPLVPSHLDPLGKERAIRKGPPLDLDPDTCRELPRQADGPWLARICTVKSANAQISQTGRRMNSAEKLMGGPCRWLGWPVAPRCQSSCERHRSFRW